jgi:hypothetical protein
VVKEELKLSLVILLLLSLLPSLMPFVEARPVMAQDVELEDVATEPKVGELVDKRTENSKTSYLGDGKYSLSSSVRELSMDYCTFTFYLYQGFVNNNIYSLCLPIL